METSLPAPAGGASPFSGLAALPVRQLLVLMFGVAALAAVIAAAFLYSKESDYRVLFANLEDRDGGAVVAALTQLEVPYRFAAGGGAILVPGDRVHDVRLKLAGQGLPRGGTVGFEILDSQKLGVTQFQERLNFQRGLEGELARSIQSLAAVRSARVHLAIPNTSAFVRKRQPPSASVLLNLHGGRVLDRGQVAGIVNLVAASVPELTPARVSVIDQDGMLLSSRETADDGLDSAQLDHARRIEASYIQRIVDILEPIVGKGNVRAQVTAEVDFTRQESTAEVYRPNQGSEPAAIRSQQLSIDPGAGSAAAEGIPGALSNQPPAAARAPANGPAQETGAGATGEGASAAATIRRDSVTNYEVDKTIRVTRSPTGTVKRVAAAVLVDYRRGVDADGGETQVALSAAELESINALVREAIGFTESRGDSLSVLNTPFTREEIPALPEIPVWKDPQVVDTAREFGKHLGLLALGLATILMVIRPALRALRTSAPPAAGRLQQVVGDDISLPSPDSMAATAASPSAEVLKLARENPGTVANVIRGWVGSEERQQR
ncbi:MAG: flagellar M-ring protein FliF [Burkholderiaceae bacterium]|nr:flagellar M-ring protein FliF [Burkholderiaceae bacterium]